MKKRKRIIRNYLSRIDIEKKIMERHNDIQLVGLKKSTGFMTVDFLARFDQIEVEQDIKDIIEIMIESLNDRNVFPMNTKTHIHKQSVRKYRTIEIPDDFNYLLAITLKKLAKEGLVIEVNGMYAPTEKLKTQLKQDAA